MQKHEHKDQTEDRKKKTTLGLHSHVVLALISGSDYKKNLVRPKPEIFVARSCTAITETESNVAGMINGIRIRRSKSG